jgi:adenylate cyclase
MGETVNLASRLEGASKLYGSHILVSQATAMAAGDAIEVREVDRVALVGQSQARPIYEIIGRKGGLTANQIELQRQYAEGLAAYRDRRWEDARAAFTAALAAVPDDGPTNAMLKRLDTMAAAPPPENWDGAWYLDQK